MCIQKPREIALRRAPSQPLASSNLRDFRASQRAGACAPSSPLRTAGLSS